MSKSKKFSPEQIAEFKKFEERLTDVTFAKKCEYPDGEEPVIKPAPKK